jgi:hypothetical protein
VKANKEMTRTHAQKSHNLLLLFSILWFQQLGETSYFFAMLFKFALKTKISNLFQIFWLSQCKNLPKKKKLIQTIQFILFSVFLM